MDIKKDLSDKYEYNAFVENTSVRLLINQKKNVVNDIIKELSHVHLYDELFVCLAGETKIQIDDYIVHLEKNDAVIVPANIPHYKIISKTDDWYSIGFSLVKKARNGTSDLYAKLSQLFDNQTVEVFRNVPDICQRVTNLRFSLPLKLDCLPAIELVCILSRLAENQSVGKNVPVATQSRMQDIYRMAWFEDLLQNRFHESITISTIAEALNVSHRQATRIIKNRYGMTFHQLLTKKRLESAVNQLCTTNQSVSRIMENVGYARSSLFYKDFAKEYGMTPTEYRRNFLKEHPCNVP